MSPIFWAIIKQTTSTHDQPSLATAPVLSISWEVPYNCKMYESDSACFLVWAVPAVHNQFLKQFSNKVLYNYCSKYVLGRCYQHLKK